MSQTISQVGRVLFTMLPDGTGQVNLSSTVLPSPDVELDDAMGNLVRAVRPVIDGAILIFSQHDKSARSEPSEEGYLATIKIDGSPAITHAKIKQVKLANDPPWWNTSVRPPNNGGINFAWLVDL